jgi:hypothetical protein
MTQSARRRTTLGLLLLAATFTSCGSDEDSPGAAREAPTTTLDRHQQRFTQCLAESADLFDRSSAYGGVEPIASEYGLATPEGQALVQIWYRYQSSAMSYGQDAALEEAVAAITEQCVQRTCQTTDGTTCWKSVRELS